MTAGLLLAAPALARDPDLGAGARVVRQGTPGGAQACAACHGADGAGQPPGGYPRLAGQGSFYLYKQMRDFADGRRDGSVMTVIARAMTDDEMQDAAGYYAAATAPWPDAAAAGDGALEQRGGVLSAAGDAAAGIPACADCHGRAGHGQPPSFPALAGQYPFYLKAQLQDWRTGARRNDALGVMGEIAVRLTDRDVDAAAEYFGHVGPPAPNALSEGR